MAPGRNNKRALAATSATEPVAKKLASTLKKQGVCQDKYKLIADALQHPLANDLPEDCRNMLLAALPLSLCVASDVRRDFQDLLVSMIGEVVSRIAEKMQDALNSESEKVKEVEASKGELEQKLKAAADVLKDAQALTSQRETELQTSGKALLGAQAMLSKLEKEQQTGDEAFQAAKVEKEAMEAAAAGDFEQLKTGEWENDEGKEMLQALRPFLAKLSMDVSLATASQNVLLKKPAQRGAFDTTVMDEVDKSFQTKISELSQWVAAEEPASHDRATVVANAKAELEAAESTQKQAAGSLMNAREAQKNAAAELHAMEVALAEYEPTFNAATEVRDDKQRQLEAFKNSSCGVFDELKCRVSPTKLKELAAAEAKAAAAAETAADAACAMTADTDIKDATEAAQVREEAVINTSQAHDGVQAAEHA
eukprot:TRINITY_DN76128_c0_g1_i1.p1 TRINITY_DN76128_c0_g1~~TRINITY_DN76128_c0_g1_i1.p1  ORF type:complete len:449 (+),score=146.44 TRINITY_DN76128_c0_g1_i1:75-1349(+)